MGNTMKDRRRSRRRMLPFVRSAVLEIDGRNHIVAVMDLGPEGAFLSTRTDVPEDRPLRLKIVIPRDGREVLIPCRLVWKSDPLDVAAGRPPGVAVRFQGLSAAAVRRIEEFASEGFLPSTDTVPTDHYEYRVLDRAELDLTELNKLGIDGWRLASALPIAAGLRLIFSRRL